MATSKKPKQKRTDAEVWDQLMADADMDRIASLSDAEVEAELREAGFDPDEIGRRGAAHAQALQAKWTVAQAPSWAARARAKLEEMRSKAGDWPAFAAMTHDELLERVKAARSDERFAAPVAFAFRKREGQEPSDDELRALLEEIEVVRRLGDGNDGAGGGD